MFDRVGANKQACDIEANNVQHGSLFSSPQRRVTEMRTYSDGWCERRKWVNAEQWRSPP